MTDPDTSAAVCYRHPDRQSWTLCQRCGRTICPECQILTPQGVRCPTCVQELGGSVQWQPANAPAPRVRTARATASRPRPRWQQILIGMVRPGSNAPVVSWSILGAVVILWIAGFVTANAPLAYLGAVPGTSWQLWRLFTSPLVYPAAASASLILGLVFNVVFFLLTAPSIERTMGRGRFLVVFFAAGA
ncbi:MAG TPA: rhomboid family intramembrane serine protease, partial [Pseudolysinimonas sp.]|nr:rhomboid family intramembrane serine protease [Pseudolysinimonas sp.]